MVLPGCWFFTRGKMKHFELTTWQPVIRSVHNQIGDSDDRAVCEIKNVVSDKFSHLCRQRSLSYLFQSAPQEISQQIKNVVSDKFSHLCRKSWLCMLVTSTVGTNKSESGWETKSGRENRLRHIFLLFCFTITTMGCNRLA